MSIRISHLPKLFGKREDTIHLHKTLGLISLIHYGYRFYQWYYLKRMTFYSDAQTFALICVHTMLSVSSLIFHLPTIRNPISPIIYPEFRAHSIIFALRSLSIMIVHWCFLYAEFDILNYKIKACVYRTIIVLVTIIAADITTKKYSPQGSTMRSMPFPEWIPDVVRVNWNMFYSICQVFATLECLMRPDMSFAFMVLFPIQLAAFLMTCVRKGIMSAFGWHVYYTSALLSTLAYTITCESAFRPFELTLYKMFAACFILLRFKAHCSKYKLWLTIICIYNLYKYKNYIM